jgi:high affinity Mn2+ porin
VTQRRHRRIAANYRHSITSSARASSEGEAFLNAGGLGVLIGDGQLPYPGLEQIFETYYSYALTPSTHLSFDYQFIANPA